MQVVCIANVKQGALYELVKIYGSQSALASRMGVGKNTLSKWIRLERLPPWHVVRSRIGDKSARLVEGALAEVGKLTSDVFPDKGVYLSSDAVERVTMREIPDEMLYSLASADAVLALPEYDQRELKEVISRQLDKLPDMQKRVVELYFGLNGEDEHTFGEIGDMYNYTGSRASQLCHKALRRLRRPESLRMIRPFVE